MSERRTLPTGVHRYTVKSTPKKEQARYYVKWQDPEHQQKVKRGFRTVTEAVAYLAEQRVSMHRGTYIDPADARVTVGQLGAGWIASHKGHLKPSSYRPLESAWRVHVEPRWGRVAVGDVRTTAVQAWVTELGEERGATTVHRAYGVLASILDGALADRRLPSNPARGVKLPRKVRAARTYLTHEQVDALALAAGERGPLILTLAYTGLRWGEVIGLRVRDVDLESRTLAVEQNAVEVGNEVVVGTPKNHQRRTVPFPAFLTAELRAASAGKLPLALVFPDQDGGFLKRPKAGTRDGKHRGWFVGAVKAAGLPHMSPHDLRHTAACLAVAAGAHVKVVQRMLGHASAAMTLDVYSDLFEDDLSSVAEALDRARGAARITHVSRRAGAE